MTPSTKTDAKPRYDDAQWEAQMKLLNEAVAPLIEELGPIMEKQDRLWKFFTMLAPTERLEPVWALYMVAAVATMVELEPSPERTLALRQLLGARADATLAAYADAQARLQAGP